MKKSIYNIIINEGYNNNLIYNSFSGALVNLNEEYYKILNNLEVSNEKSKIIDELKNVGLLVEDSVDEIKVLERKRNEIIQNESILSLTIAPTLNCNLNCSYCFEEKKVGIMNTNTLNNIVTFVKNTIINGKIKKISIKWFGGEPLMAKNIIYDLSEKLIGLCENNNIKYEAGIITNGCLIDDDFLVQAVRYKINFFQITLDGTREFHNKVKKFNNDKPTFDIILNNIKKVKSYGIKTIVRVNVSRANSHCLDDLIEFLQCEKLDDVHIYLGYIQSFNNKLEFCSNKCLTKEEYSKRYIDFYKKITDKQFTYGIEKQYPKIRINYCGATKNNSFVIDNDGYIYKCWNEIGNRDARMCTIEQLDVYDGNNHKYADWNPYKNKECIKCNVLPICGGGCPNLSNIYKQLDCQQSKYGIKELMKEIYCYKKGRG
ncbi:radical SAM protein [Clostridium sp. ZBS15]|uniref:radical SAM/SPASM domain-containing protein n=1 Tax=Clostridium sp. ZBS15 TaxID=2949969 RepID=UPI0020793DE4|nr:radical SAM protein [Clostridium sp. ZBS15]